MIDTLLAKTPGNFLCVCVCAYAYGCERVFERGGMLMSIAERLSPFFSQWTGCSQGKPKTHESSCPLPTSNVPACTSMCSHTCTDTVPAIALSLLFFLLLPLSFSSLSSFRICWTGLGPPPFLVLGTLL